MDTVLLQGFDTIHSDSSRASDFVSLSCFSSCKKFHQITRLLQKDLLLPPSLSTPSTPSEHTCCPSSLKTNPKAATLPSVANRIAVCHHILLEGRPSAANCPCAQYEQVILRLQYKRVQALPSLPKNKVST
ncbi:hypothetical protein AMECASPLE_036966 [Ameca splendens]|uniref:Uncharacterized protein n=1 Tax=Ameca splendens TaxID=208324 RepID=A0ABV0Y7M1_9TELE